VLAVLMLEGSTNRLAAGALIAAFTVPFMFFALYHLYQLIKPAGQKYSVLCTLILFVAISWSPLAHAAFFFVGETFKTAISADAANTESVLILGKTFTNMLYKTWIPAVSMTGLGWLLVSVAILRGKTNFPHAFAFFTPLPMSFVFILVVPLFPTALAVLLAGAMGNLAVIVFYTLNTIFCFRYQFTDSELSN
jgi:hypothetical protein